MADRAEVFLEFDGVEFLGVDVNTVPFPFEEVEPNRIRLVNLPPNAFAIWYYIHRYDCNGLAEEYFGTFRTGPPTPSPTPTPVPTGGGSHWILSSTGPWRIIDAAAVAVP